MCTIYSICSITYLKFWLNILYYLCTLVALVRRTLSFSIGDCGTNWPHYSFEVEELRHTSSFTTRWDLYVNTYIFGLCNASSPHRCSMTPFIDEKHTKTGYLIPIVCAQSGVDNSPWYKPSQSHFWLSGTVHTIPILLTLLSTFYSVKFPLVLQYSVWFHSVQVTIGINASEMVQCLDLCVTFS